MKEKTPQEKKALSYAKDRRNAYGANDKASRNSIPKRKAGVNRTFRRDISEVLNVVSGILDLEVAEEVEHRVRSVKRADWKKFPDRPLGEVVEESIENRVDHAGKGKSALKAVREFIANLKIEAEQIEPDKWVARASDYPWIVATAVSKLRAVEKLQHIMTVAKRNDQGADISIQIDGEFITPTLAK